MYYESVGYERLIALPAPGTETFFLWGPRQSGKTTLLRAAYPDEIFLDLLDTRLFRTLSAAPNTLGDIVRAGPNRMVVIDEIQKIPALLDEVHRLHEQGYRFALCGSSARKTRRGHANLLGGRALRFEMFGLIARELGDGFNLTRMLNHGYMPRIYDAENPVPYLQSYVADYLKEEIIHEGLIRAIAPFDDFLRQAALSDAQIVNAATIARECGVSRPTIQAYFQILEDTLLGRFLPAYTKRNKRRVTQKPKFYFHDVAVVATLARRGRVMPGSELYGMAFENWVFHELTAYNAYKSRYADLSYWRLASGIEVDFLVNGAELAIECKATARIRPEHLRNLREFKGEHPEVKRRILVSLVPERRMTEDGIEIVNPATFTQLLWEAPLF